MFVLLKQKLQKATNETAKKWQVNNIRLQLLKIGGSIKINKRRVYYSLSKAYVHQKLFMSLFKE